MAENLRTNLNEMDSEVERECDNNYLTQLKTKSENHVNITTINMLCEDNIIIEANRMLLASRSEYFKSIFTRTGFIEHRSNIMPISGINSTTMNEIVTYCKTGEIILTLRNVQLIFKATDYLQINNLRSKCVDFMTTNVDEESCLDIFNIAERTGDIYLADKCKNMIEFNFINISRHPPFLEMKKHELVKILKTFRLCLPDEESLYTEILKWIKYDYNVRYPFYHELTDLIHLRFISTSSSSEQIDTNNNNNNYVIEKSDSVSLFMTYQPENLINQNNIEHFYMRDMMVQCGCWNYEDFLPSYDDKMRCYDMETKSWHICGTLPRKTDRQCVVILFNQIYMLGGKIGNEFSEVSNKVDIFDSRTKEWLPGKPMNFKRFDFYAGVIDDKIFVIGGKSSDYDIQLLVGEMYNPKTNQWTVLSNLRKPSFEAPVEFINNKIYFIENEMIKIFNLNTSEWTQVILYDRLPGPGLRTTLLKDTIYMYNQQMVGDVYTFNTITNNHEYILINEAADTQQDEEEFEQHYDSVYHNLNICLETEFVHSAASYKNTIFFIINRQHYPRIGTDTIVYDSYSNSFKQILTSNYMSRAVIFAKIQIPYNE